MLSFVDQIAALKGQDQYRSLTLPQDGAVDLSSNDYLGFANHPALRQAAIDFLGDENNAIGAAGSRLLRGHHPAHASLEATAAKHFGVEATLYFANGYAANMALLSALPQRTDIIIYDALVHASMRESIQNASAKSYKFPHNNAEALEDLLKTHYGKRIWICVESVYSMDGDIAPLDQIMALAARYNAFVMLDEAHSTGIYGDHGEGVSKALPHQERLVSMHTCGKALGVAGALVCGSRDVIDWLINKARPFIYSTAPMPVQAHVVETAIELCAGDEGTQARKRLEALCEQAKNLFGGAGTPITPIIIGDASKALEAAAHMQAQGYDIRAIRPPTVPKGSARLRLTLTANLDPAHLPRIAGHLKAYL